MLAHTSVACCSLCVVEAAHSSLSAAVRAALLAALPHTRVPWQKPVAVAESSTLRTLVTDFNNEGSPLLHVPPEAIPSMREKVKRRVSTLLSSAKSWVVPTS
jgi:hypothetical protein